MARAATTSDAFNAIAEPRRRQILAALAGGEVPVATLVATLEASQPQVSKHLKVLRRVDLVRCRTAGRQRLYRLNGPALAPVQDWVNALARQWNARFDRLDDYLAEIHDEGTAS
jgi:DNA-binding transcriptional ArsR family regulator